MSLITAGMQEEEEEERRREQREKRKERNGPRDGLGSQPSLIPSLFIGPSLIAGWNSPPPPFNRGKGGPWIMTPSCTVVTYQVFKRGDRIGGGGTKHTHCTGVTELIKVAPSSSSSLGAKKGKKRKTIFDVLRWIFIAPLKNHRPPPPPPPPPPPVASEKWPLIKVGSWLLLLFWKMNGRSLFSPSMMLHFHLHHRSRTF